MKYLQNQLEKSICKNKCKDNSNGTGFFCNFSFPDKNNLLLVLITNYHVLEKKDIIEGKEIEIFLNNDRFSFKIRIDKNRKIYANEIPYDVTIIEIKKEDAIDLIEPLEIDENIYKENPNEIYKKIYIYSLQYPNGFNAEYCLGRIKNIFIEDCHIEHLCETKYGCSGSPLINYNNNKVLGFHKGKEEKEDWNVGTYIKGPLEKFYEKNKN